MRLAEALMERSDMQRRIESLRSRIQASARYQEGEDPAEDAAALLAEAGETVDRLAALVTRINLTNTAARLDDGTPLTAALARGTRSGRGTGSSRPRPTPPPDAAA